MFKPITQALLLVLFLAISLTWQTSLSKEHTWQEAFEFLGISWNKDGTTLNRTIKIPMVDPTPDSDTKPVPKALSQDIYLGPYIKAYIRLYIPLNPPPKDKKLPLIIYFHSGEFVLYSVSTVSIHNFCDDMASKLPAVVASVEYRLAPENRLPAAYEDALDAIFWAKDQALEIGGRDPWMEYADFSRVFLVGSSAGANIAYHATLQVMQFDIRPLKIKGLFLNQPFFGGVEETGVERMKKEDPYIPLYVNHVLWNLSLPVNATRDHEFCNVYTSKTTYKDRISRLPKVVIKTDFSDPLWQRALSLRYILKGAGVDVLFWYRSRDFHGEELVNAKVAQALNDDIKSFVDNVGAADRNVEAQEEQGSYEHASS